MSNERRKIIDCEHHFYGNCLFDYLKTRTDFPYYRKDDNTLHMSDRSYVTFNVPSHNNPKRMFYQDIFGIDDGRIKIMDEAGITTGVLSTSDAIEGFPKEESVRFAKATNDEVAAACKKYPGRFIGTIALPTPYVEESIEELERAVKVLGLRCWHTHSTVGTERIYEDKYEPIFAKCEELDVPFYVHPCYPTNDYLLDRGFTLSAAALGFGVDTMKTTMSLILGGLFDRHPKLTMIIGHMGEFYPYILNRMDHMTTMFKEADPFNNSKETFEHYFRNGNIYVTTSGIFDPDVVLFAMKKIGVDRILLGTDYPYEHAQLTVDMVENLPISEEDKDMIFYKNAERLILKQ